MAPTAAMIGFAAPFAMFLAGCGDDDAATQNIAEIAGGAKELSTLDAALKATKLASTVADTKDITVFAPTNDAFDALDKTLLTCLLEPVGLPTLADVLKYHVVPQKAMAADLKNDQSLSTLDGQQNLTVMLDGSTVTIKGGASEANVSKADILATNGVVHELDAVLIPENFTAPQCGNGTIAETAVGNEDLQTLVAALTAADLVSTFNGTDVFTVFAPTDEAFAALGNETISCLLDKKNVDALKTVLTYHVVSGYDLASDIKNGLQVETLETENLTFTVKGKNVMIDTTANTSANVVAADVFATNGVVHVIDAVLIPKDFVDNNPCSKDYVADAAIVV
jgi:transforming growth factor-beta-induced protein